MLLFSFTVNWILTFQDKPIGFITKTGLVCLAVKTRFFFFRLWHASKWYVKWITQRGDIPSLITAPAMCLPATCLFQTQCSLYLIIYCSAERTKSFYDGWWRNNSMNYLDDGRINISPLTHAGWSHTNRDHTDSNKHVLRCSWAPSMEGISRSVSLIHPTHSTWH